MIKRLLAPALLAAGLLPQLAQAQAYQCRAPRTLEPVKPVTPDGPVRKVAIGGYTLAASWSPDWCKTHPDTASMQCSKRYGRFGFVLHGLWPEGVAGGPYPQWCASTPVPTPRTLRQHLCMTPSAQLLAHEWAKHGSCMAKTPEKYFATGARLWKAIAWPDADRLSRKKDLTAGDFRDTFKLMNPDWPRAAIGIQTSRSGWLSAVELCYGANLRPKACSSRQFGTRDAAPMKIWRGL